MKTLESLENYYNKELLSKLKELDKDRKANSRLFITLFVIISIPAALVFYALLPENDRAFRFYILGFGGIYLLILYTIFQYLNRKYKYNYKHFIIKNIIHFINPSLQYHPDKNIERSNFLNSLLFNNDKLTAYSGDDFVSGVLGKTKIRFSDINAGFNFEYFNFYQSEKTLEFYGLFFIADFNKHFTGTTIVLPKKSAIKKLYYKPSSFNSNNPLEVIKLDNIDFQKHFAVYGTNQIEARYILTNNLMDKLLLFQERTGVKTQVSFVNSNIYIAIPRHGTSFEPEYFSSIVNFESIKNYLKDLQLAISIVDELNLNIRIWTKE